VKPLVGPPSEQTAAARELVLPHERDDDTSIERRFHELARQWREATAFTSSTTEMINDQAYQQIIGMGREVVPFLLAELRREPDHWFWALKAITGHDPVPPADRGNIRRMAQAWLEWAEREGY
jgi:hypothetical protein